MSYLERYQNGEQVAVWEELVALGNGVRHELYYEDAVAVATETMRRARHNVELLIHRLSDLGYRFIAPADDRGFDLEGRLAQVSLQIGSRPGVAGIDMRPYIEQAAGRVKEMLGPLAGKISARKDAQAAKVAAALTMPPLENLEVFDPPGKQTGKDLKALENACGGPLPISLRAWYEQVGGVSLMGSHPVLNPMGDSSADPLVVDPLKQVLSMIDGFGMEGEMEIWLAPDDFHKADISGGEPYSVTIPDAAADVAFKYEWHDTTFVNYLRKSFEWGGFPGWERNKKRAPMALIAQLADGMLPI